MECAGIVRSAALRSVVARSIFILAVAPLSVAFSFRVRILLTALASVVQSGWRTLRTHFARALFLEIATAVKALNTIRHTTGVGRVSVPGTSLAERCVARFLVAFEKAAVIMPAVAALIVTLPGALDLARALSARPPAWGHTLIRAIESTTSMVARCTAKFLSSPTRPR